MDPPMVMEEHNKVPRKPFAVVLFEKEQKYSTVPGTWISEEQEFCFWPARITKNQAALLEDPLSTPQKNWTKHKISYVKFFDSFSKAQKKSQKLKNKSFSEIPSTEDEAASSSSCIQNLIAVSPPPLPHIPATIASGSTLSQELADDEEQFSVIPVVNNVDFEIFKKENLNFQELVLQKLEEIASDVRDIRRQNRQLLAQTNSEVECDERSYPPLPLKSLDKVEETEKIIRDKFQFKKLVDELQRVGGATLNKNVYNILRHSLHPDVAKQFRITAKSDKKPFVSMKLATAIRTAVQALHGITATDSEINKLMGNFFRGNNPRKPKNETQDVYAENNKNKKSDESSESVVSSDSSNSQGKISTA